MNHIHADKRETKDYTVTIAFITNDGHDDKNHMPEDSDPLVYHLIIPAESTMQAIQRGMEIVTITKAEQMTDFLPGHPLVGDKESLTMEEIEMIREISLKEMIFRDWLSIEPTSIQCHLTSDEDRLFDLTQVNISKVQERIGDDVEEFLKEINNDDA
jgi:hypothetical protein